MMSQPQDTLVHALIDSARNRPAEDPIFAIHGAALERAARGEDVIDASLGSLMDEDGGLSVMPTVTRTLALIDPKKAASYAPIAGEREFNQAVVDDVFGPAHLAQDSLCVATAGGTGALHHAVQNFLNQGEALLTTDYFWGPYGTIADQAGRGVETFRMFDASRRFDLEALETGLHDLAARQERILLILNFPCHNPTGYSLSEGEWKDVVRILSGMDRAKPMALLLDLAYARFGAPGTESWVHHVGELVERMPVLAAWSASKSYAQYGARIGGLAVAYRNSKERTRIGNALSYTCRGTWSNCNHLGMLAVTELLRDSVLREALEADRAELITMLGERVECFNREAARHGLAYPRYEGGFFVTVFTSDPAETARRCQADGVFLVPIRGAVRVALCATPKSKVPRLVDSIARGVEGLQGAHS